MASGESRSHGGIHVEGDRGTVSQTVVAGTLGAPWLFSSLLMAVVFLLGVCVAQLYQAAGAMREVKTEIRILEVHVQDTNAILIREGLMKPGDKLRGPTSGEVP